MNGITLNELALEMSERLGFHEIDASVLSRVLKGERIFTQKQLSVFCRTIKLNRTKEDLLKATLHAEIYSRFQGRFLLDIDRTQFLDMAESNLVMVKDANESGASILAKEWAQIMENRLKEEIVKTSDELARTKLKELLFGFLEQHSISVLRRESPSTAYKNAWLVLKGMKAIANELRNFEKLGLVYAKMGDVLSLVGGETCNKLILNKSSDFFRKSLEHINLNLAYYPLGCWMLNESYLKNFHQFKKLKNDLATALQNCEPSEVCEGYNLIAKSKINIGDSKDLETVFVQGWNFYNKISDKGWHSKQFRKVQLSRTEVQALTAGYRFHQEPKIKSIVTDCLYTAKNLGYIRYFLTAKEMLRDNPELLTFKFAG